MAELDPTKQYFTKYTDNKLGSGFTGANSANTVTEQFSNVYTKSEVNAMRAPSYNPTTKTMVFPATSTFVYSADTKTIILSH